MMRQKGTAAPPTPSARQIGPVKKTIKMKRRKKKERYRDSVVGTR
jgi:hypothetical protein